ncbi:DNA alkylation repair protein [Nocardioides marmoriginsengisoli]|uniref:DNA alkylation repair protein n=1 Tax=Nocardioides marmoriginsengisoli TaxID=661483 RepID=A0A3N0CI88_9ACTN|nr:DNA alkylation repair protein [Nocardioides marmoriginsengisoli]RNL62991.1 DNA alkylation repair protein [Nocardioides marmoriginsengisoli]
MTELADRLHRELHEAADPELAPAMAAYMKVAENGTLPFLGIRRPAVRRLARAAAKGASPELLVATVRDLWENADYREERYAAQDILGLRWSAGRLDLLDLHREMAQTGAWWDHVDEVAHRIADLLDTHPVEVSATLREWSTSEDLWLRRLAIIGQLGRRERVDLDLLAAVIEPNTADREFFIRKAIGWALRDAARVRAAWVLDFVATTELSPLSRREALKHLG